MTQIITLSLALIFFAILLEEITLMVFVESEKLSFTLVFSLKFYFTLVRVSIIQNEIKGQREEKNPQLEALYIFNFTRHYPSDFKL